MRSDSHENDLRSTRNNAKLSKFIKPYWKYAVAAPLLMLVEVACDLMQPRLMGRIIDEGVAKGDLSYIIRTGGLMFLIALGGIVGGMGCTVFAALASQHFGADLRDELYRRVQSFSFRNLDKFSNESLITRLTNDVMQLQGIVQMMLRVMVRAPILCVGGIVMALSIHPRIALISLSVLPLLAVLLVVVIRKGFPLFGMVQKRLDRLNLVIRENLTGIRVVKAFVRADHEEKRFGRTNADFAEMSTRATRVVGASMPMMMLVMNTGIILAIWFGGLQVHVGGLRIGEVMALLNYVTQILFALMMSAMLLMAFSRAKVSADRTREVLAEVPDIVDGRANGPLEPGRVTFERVSFGYETDEGKEVVRDISFSARPGETIAILGATGVGKSSLVNLIPRFYDATEGDVFVHGRNVRDWPLAELRASIGMVQQESILFTGTIRENLRRGNQGATDEMVEEAAKVAQAHDFINDFPHGYGTELGQRGVNLSGGQKQRLCIARALLRKPDILILDDSTSAVDLFTEARFREALNGMLSETTVFLIAQRISSVMNADRILLLDRGCISGNGTHEELMQENAVYREIYQSQAGEGDFDLSDSTSPVADEKLHVGDREGLE